MYCMYRYRYRYIRTAVRHEYLPTWSYVCSKLGNLSKFVPGTNFCTYVQNKHTTHMLGRKISTNFKFFIDHMDNKMRRKLYKS